MSCHRNFNSWLCTSPRLISRRHNKRSEEAFQLRPCTAEDDEHQSTPTLSDIGEGGDGNDGAVRVKFVVSKKQLRKMLACMGSQKGNQRQGSLRCASSLLQPTTLEQLLHVLRRRHVRQVNSVKGRRRSWAPSLQSIPEEI